MKPLLILKTGHALTDLRVYHGDFEDWFHEAMDVGHPITVHTVVQSEPPDACSNYAGVVVTGSPAMVSHKDPWSEAAASWLQQTVNRGVPVLGVCYGHQLLAHSLGGKVGPNPKGRQMGTQPVEFLPAALTDPLMAGLPQRVDCQTSHKEAVLALPPGAVRLARAPRDGNHAFRYGACAWGVQFHPEFSAAAMEAYVNKYKNALLDEGQDPEALAAGIKETPLVKALLRRFALLALQASSSAA